MVFFFKTNKKTPQIKIPTFPAVISHAHLLSPFCILQNPTDCHCKFSPIIDKLFADPEKSGHFSKSMIMYIYITYITDIIQ